MNNKDNSFDKESFDEFRKIYLLFISKDTISKATVDKYLKLMNRGSIFNIIKGL